MMLSNNLLLLLSIVWQTGKAFSKGNEDNVNTQAYASFSLPLQHAFGTGDDVKFTPRGMIVFKTLRSTSASLAREVSLTNEEYEKLEELVRNDGIYRIRSPIRIGESFDKAETFYVSSFVKACHLLYSGLSEIITVSVDNSGNVIGISVRTEKKECPQNFEETEVKMDASRTFNTTIMIQLQTPGAVPETQSFVKQMEKEESEKLSGKEKDTRSFLAKYWMYILPVVFILMMAGQQETQEGGEAS